MSFFDNIFGKSTGDNASSFWIKLESLEDLNNAIEESKTKKVVIFKHSTKCHISKMVLSKFENEAQNSSKDAAFYFLDLIANRNISNAIAENLNITHQSPQLLIVENGVVEKHASHNDATFDIV